MPMVGVTANTLQLIRAKRPAAFRFASAATRLDDGSWNIPVDDEVAMKIALERVRGEADDGVVSRVVACEGYPWVGGSLPVKSR